MADDFTVTIEGYGNFKTMIDKYVEQFGSAKIPFAAVLKYFWQWNEINIFGLSGPGQYADLSDAYQNYKENVVGFIYPMLKFDGILEASITGEDSVYSVAQIYDDHLIMGTNATSKNGTPYPYYLNEGTYKMPARPFIIKNKEQMESYARIFKETFVRQLDAIKGQ